MFAVSRGLYEGAARLAHFLAVDSEEAVNEEFVCGFETRPDEHRGPEQGVKIHNVFADEVVKLVIAAVPDGIEIEAVFIAVIFGRCHIADWSVEPDVEIFIFFAGDFEAEIRAVARDVPVLQTCAEPFVELVGDGFLDIALRE